MLGHRHTQILVHNETFSEHPPSDNLPRMRPKQALQNIPIFLQSQIFQLYIIPGQPDRVDWANYEAKGAAYSLVGRQTPIAFQQLMIKGRYNSSAQQRCRGYKKLLERVGVSPVPPARSKTLAATCTASSSASACVCEERELKNQLVCPLQPANLSLSLCIHPHHVFCPRWSVWRKKHAIFTCQRILSHETCNFNCCI